MASKKRIKTPSEHSPAKRPAVGAPAHKALPKIPIWAVASFLVLLVAIFYGPLITGSKFLWEDFVEQEFPFRTYAATMLASGSLPHWNPYIFAGMPFLADLQTAFWYPTNMLQSLFVSEGHLSPVVMQFFIVLHYVVAGLGMYFFTRRILRASEWGSLLAAISYAFGGFITMQIIHQMIVYQIALFPFVALLLIEGFDSWKAMIGSGILLGAMYLAGHPQTSLYLSLLLGVVIIYEWVYRLTRKADFSVLFALRSVLPVLIAIGIFAIQFLPSQELAELSRRDVITYQKSVEGSLGWGNLLTLVMPRLFGLTDAAQMAKVPYWNGAYYLSWETAIYIGVFPLVFGLIAAAAGWERKYVGLFAGMAGVSLLFALGDSFFLYKIFFNLPLFDKFRTPARMAVVFGFSFTVLSAVGFDLLTHAERSQRVRKAGFIAVGLIAFVWLLGIAGLISAATFQPGITPEANASISWAAGLATLPVLAVIIVVLLLLFRKIPNLPAAVVILGVTVLELFQYGMGVNFSETDPRIAYRQQPELISMLAKDQATELSRARTRLGGTMLVKRNQGAYDRIQLMEGYNPLVLKRVSPEAPEAEQLDLMNVKWSIVTGVGQSGFEPRTSYLPRAKMYFNAKVLADEQAIEFLRADSSFDYRNTILLEASPAEPLGSADPAAVAAVTKYTPNEITVNVKTASRGMLFLSEVYYPAWKAYVDGKPAAVLRAFTTLRAVEVPAGDHRVVMRYESKAFATGSVVTLITLLASFGALGYFGIRSSKKSEENEQQEAEDQEGSSE